MSVCGFVVICGHVSAVRVDSLCVLVCEEAKIIEKEKERANINVKTRAARVWVCLRMCTK